MTPAHSPDGRWWHDGTEWKPAFSGDMRSWFDGTQWISGRTTAEVRAPAVKGPIGAPYFYWLASVFSAPLFLVVAVVALDGHRGSQGLLTVAKVLALLGLVGTGAFGIAVAQRRRWWHMLWAPLIAGAGLAAWFALIANVVVDNSEDADQLSAGDVAGAGVGCAVVAAVVMGVGLGIGALTNLKARRS